MREQIYNMVLATLLLLAGSPMKLHAQTSTLKFSAVKSVADASSKDIYSETGCVYLYNVGSGEYVNFGGYWGTQPLTHEVGMPLYIDRGTGDSYSGTTETVTEVDDNENTTSVEETGVYYKIGSRVDINYSGASVTYNGDGFFGYVRNCDGGNYSNSIFVDREGTPTHMYDGIVRMIFTEISSDSNGPIYNISFRNYAGINHDANGDWPTASISGMTPTTYYLVAQAGDNEVVEAVAESGSEADNSYAQWRLVTRGDFIDDFQYTNEANQTESANATFLVVDQNFNRNNANQEVLTVKNSTDQTNNVWKFSSTDATATLTIGCGTGNQATYGAYWLAMVSGAGELYQSIADCPEAGWYQLKLKGFSTGSDAANVFIRVLTTDSEGNTSVESTSTTQLHQFTDDSFDVTNQEDLMKLDKELIAASSTYQTETYAMVYIAEGATFQIGVTANANSGYTLIDDVQLYYAGSSYPPYVLDERWQKLDSINSQVSTTGDTRTLLLKRSFVKQQWNSLLLPVSLTVKQVKDAFGGDTQVCQLEKTENNGYDIYFSSIPFDTDTPTTGSTNDITTPLSNTDVLIEAGAMYIIWPSDLTLPTSDAKYVYKDENDDEQTLKLDAPYFSIPLVAIKNEVESKIVTDTKVVTSGVDNGIRMQGTYVWGEEIPRYSYAISSSNGKWYYLTTQSSTDATSSGVKSLGYRAWIVTEQATSNAPAVANLFIDDVQVTDGIEGVVQDMLRQETVGSVYALSGQMVNADGSLEGLPKGIYVKGGKKYVVK